MKTITRAQIEQGILQGRIERSKAILEAFRSISKFYIATIERIRNWGLFQMAAK